MVSGFVGSSVNKYCLFFVFVWMFCKQSEVCFNSTFVQFGLSCYLCVKLFSHFVNVVDSCALAPFPQFCDRHCFVDM